MRKGTLYIISIIVLGFSIIFNPFQTKAVELGSNELVTLYSEDEEIILFEDQEGIKPILTISNGDTIEIVKLGSPYVFVHYKDKDQQTWEGYIHEKFIANNNTDNEAQHEEEKLPNTSEIKESTEQNTNEPVEPINVVQSIEPIKTVVKQETNQDSMKLMSTSTTINTQSTATIQGIAVKNPTYVYQSTSTSSKKLKSYPIGTILKYKTYNANWYSAVVYINGVKHNGFISKNDVDHLTGSKTLYGYALYEKIHVYTHPSTSSKVLKSYPYGSKLKYTELSENWYQATVKYNGKWETGYIHKSHVAAEIPVLSGYSQKEPTNVYENTSKSSKVLKTYRAGQLLKYRNYNSNWYIATVIINGKAQTGFIAKDDVGDKITTISGYAQLDIVNVYEKTSKNSKALKSYKKGHLLKYKPYNSSWYSATVYINGKPVTGYIYRSDVGHTPPVIEGFAQLEPIGVYANTSKGSTVLKTYRAGSKLKYRPYNNNWYIATVIISGKKHTGYIHKNDVGSSIPTLHGFPKNSKVSVYSNTNKAKVLKTYAKGSLLKYRPYNSSWYSATVYVNGKKHTGYIPRAEMVTATGRTIIIDAGHGGSDPGAVGNGLREKDINLDIALRAKQQLEAAGFKVVLTRSKDEFLSLQQRSSMANSLNADLFISIHVNSATSASAQGIETYWYDKYEAQNSQRLATLVQQEIIKQTKAKNRGVNKGNFHVIRETKMPSVLIETGFISNKQDAQKLKSATYKNQIVKGIVAAVKRYFHIL